MAYSETINLVKDDTLPLLYFTLKDSNKAAVGSVLDPDDPDTWAPIDLTSCTVLLKIRTVGSTEVKSTVTCTLDDASNGKVFAQFDSTTLDTAGVFEGEIEITKSNGGIQTVYDLVRLKVRNDF